MLGQQWSGRQNTTPWFNHRPVIEHLDHPHQSLPACSWFIVFTSCCCLAVYVLLEICWVKGKCWDYSPIVQRPYGLGVAKTVLCICRHRQVCVLYWTSVYSLIRKTWGVKFVHKLTPTVKCATAGIWTLVCKLPVQCFTTEQAYNNV